MVYKFLDGGEKVGGGGGGVGVGGGGFSYQDEEVSWGFELLAS